VFGSTGRSNGRDLCGTEGAATKAVKKKLNELIVPWGDPVARGLRRSRRVKSQLWGQQKPRCWRAKGRPDGASHVVSSPTFTRSEPETVIGMNGEKPTVWPVFGVPATGTSSVKLLAIIKTKRGEASIMLQPTGKDLAAQEVRMVEVHADHGRPNR